MNEFQKVINIFNKYNRINYSNDNIFKSINNEGQLSEKENIHRRSHAITDILINYRDQQSSRYKYKKQVKKVFVPVFCGVAGLFVVMMVTAVVLSFVFLQDQEVEFLTAIIGSLVTGFSAVISILLIITHYIFPNDEEKNFNDLISIIVKNDTERLAQIAHEGDNYNKNSHITGSPNKNKNSDKKDEQ